MYNRMNFPSGAPAILLVAVAVAPVVIKKCKPAVVALGNALVKAGNAVNKVAEARG